MLERTAKIARTWGAPAAVLVLAGCAGGFSEDHSITRISTEPPGARCTLTGAGFTQIVVTPAHVVLPKEAAPVTMSCAGEGHHTFVAELRPVFNDRVFGNLLFVSMLAFVVDFTNGHSVKYPRNLHAHMEPVVFPSIAARDRWFDRYQAHLVEKWDGVKGSIGNGCGGANNADRQCIARLQAAEADSARELAMLEERRRQARVQQVDSAQDTGGWPE